MKETAKIRKTKSAGEQLKSSIREKKDSHQVKIKKYVILGNRSYLLLVSHFFIVHTNEDKWYFRFYTHIFQTLNGSYTKQSLIRQ